MSFIACLTKNNPQENHKQQNINKRSQSSIIKKKKEIGDYILCKTIGRGASGRVKLGIHKQTGEKVAIKMISRSQLTASASTAKSVERELAILQLLHHPHLVELYQVLQDSSYVYFVMEYLEGGELFHILAERGRLLELDARRLFAQLITALHWCHVHHISHRDLKPENILLDQEQKNLKIADFGMASMQPLNTLLKTSCGSPHYASPEIVRGKRYDGKATDVWSCGVILHAMVTGHLPFDDENMSRLLTKIKSGRYRSLPDYLSKDAKDLIKRMLVVDPAKRITMAEIPFHPWLLKKSSFITDARFEQASLIEYDPLQDHELQEPIVTNKLDLDGRVWETLKVLWREKSEDEIIKKLSSYGFNLQKLTCKLLQERSYRQQSPDNYSSISLPRRRSSVMTDDVLMTPPLRSLRHISDDIDSYMLSSSMPYDSAIDSVSCCNTLDFFSPTPTVTFQQLNDYQPYTINSDIVQHNKKILADKNLVMQPKYNPSTIVTKSIVTEKSISQPFWIHDDGELVQTIEKKGIKSDVADTFIMTKPIGTLMHSHSQHDVWKLCSKESNWVSKLFDYLYKTKNVITIESSIKNEFEAIGKLHQILKEFFEGKLRGKLYPDGKITWRGSMRDMLSFSCHMPTNTNNKIKIQFVLERGDADKFEINIQNIIDCLNQYEHEANWVARNNGWAHY